MLAGVAAHGGFGLQGTAGGEIAALINAHHVTASAAMTDITNAVMAQAITSDQAVGLLAGVAGHGGAALQSAVAGEIRVLMGGSIMGNYDPKVVDWVRDIASAVVAHSLTLDQAITLVYSIDQGLRNPVSAGGLDLPGKLSVSDEIARLDIDADEFAQISDEVKLGAAISAAEGRIPAPGATALPPAIVAIDNAVVSGIITAEKAIGELLGLAKQGDVAFQTAAGREIAALIDQNRISADQATADIDKAVTSHALTVDRGIALLNGMAAVHSPDAQAAVGREFWGLVSDNQILADRAVFELAVAQLVQYSPIAAMTVHYFLNCSHVGAC